MAEILRCHQVVKHYAGVVALSGVDLGVEEGQIVGLVGANGAGKSTLIDIISGAAPSTGGEVRFADRPLKGGAAARARAGMARTFQHPQVARELTLRENILCGLAAHTMGSPARILALGLRSVLPLRSDRSRVEEVAASVGLRDIDRLAGSVSFGDLRLVEVARALIARPRFVMLDEPFPGVDDDGVAGVLDALRAMRSAGQAILLVDHNVDVVASVADRLVLLAGGKVVVDGDVETATRSREFREQYIGVV